VYNSEISYNGVWGDGPADDVAIQLYAGVDHVWILNNNIHHNSGDSIMFCHTCVGGGSGPAYVYISGNTLHDEEENAIDLKEFIGPVIISENEIYNFVPSVESNGDAIRINDEGTQGDVWILNNYVHDSTYGVNATNADGNVYVLGTTLPTALPLRWIGLRMGTTWWSATRSTTRLGAYARERQRTTSSRSLPSVISVQTLPGVPTTWSIKTLGHLSCRPRVPIPSPTKTRS